MLKVCLVVDVEGFIGIKKGNPRWSFFEKIFGKINYALRNFLYNEKGFDVIYKTIIKEKFPSTFMLVGSLYKPLEKYKFIEWGYHTLNHKPLTLISDNEVEKEVKNIYKVASFSPPLWMVEDASNPERIFKILKKENYKYIIYRGKDYGLKHKHHFEIIKPKKFFGLKLIHVSNWMEGNYSKKQLQNILREIKKNASKDAVYCITTHDFTYRNNKILELLIRGLRRLERENKIKICTIKEIK